MLGVLKVRLLNVARRNQRHVPLPAIQRTGKLGDLLRPLHQEVDVGDIASGWEASGFKDNVDAADPSSLSQSIAELSSGSGVRGSLNQQGFSYA
jgi:hypothetical protein